MSRKCWMTHSTRGIAFLRRISSFLEKKAVALAHLFLHLPSHQIIRLGGGKCALNENSFGLVLSSAREDLVLSDMRAWRGAREGAWGILCPSCWQGIPLQSLKGSGSQSSQGSAAKRESDSHLGSSRRLCSLQYVSNNKSSHWAGLRVFWDKALTALNWSNFALAPSASGSITLTFHQRLVRVIRDILCMFRCLSEQVPGLYCPCSHSWAPEKPHSADLLNSKHRKAWKTITPPLLETDWKGKAQKRKRQGWVLISATKVLGQCWPTKEIYHIFSLLFGALADDLNICISQVNVYNFITRGFVRW